MATPEIATTYLDAHGRIDALVRPLDAEALARPVACCPGWTVRDVVAHLAGTVRWAVEGRLRGIPTPDVTAEQVAELGGTPVDEVLDEWAGAAPTFAERVAAGGVWPAAIDAVTHEFDIRHALGDEHGRDEAAVDLLADLLIGSWAPPRPVRVELGDRRHDLSGADADPDPLVLRTTPFEALRFRLGRRSRSQVAAMDWSADPGDVLDGACIFGPADADIDEA